MSCIIARDRLGRGHVAGQRDRLPAGRVDLRHRIARRGGVEIGDRDARPLAHHRERGGASDAAAASGDQRDLAVEDSRPHSLGHPSLLPICSQHSAAASLTTQCAHAPPHRRHLDWKDELMTEDWGKISADLERLLKLRSFVFGMKLFETREEMEAIPRIRRPKTVHTLDQIVAQAARLGWTVGITAEDLVGAQCRAVVGLGNAKDDAWRSGKHMVGRLVQHARRTPRAHQAAMECVPDGRYEALARVAAGERPARPARHRAVLRDARRDDLFHQRAAMGRLQELRLERRRRVGLRRFLGPRAEDPRSRACRSRALPSAAMAACSTTRC